MALRLSVQSLSHVRLFATPWIAACQASLSITNSWSSPKLMSTKSVMPSSHLLLFWPLLLLPPIPPRTRVFSNESTLHMRRPKYWSFSLSISPSKEHPGLISSGWNCWVSLQSKGLSRVFSNTTVYILIRLTKIKHKEQILKAAREKQQITHKGIPIRITADLSIELFKPGGNGKT